jgi:group II intron reverse transcriptase/maturase
LVAVLEQIYEVDFQGFSYGFRPGRGAHDALDALSVGLTERPIQWVLDADIQAFFDRLDHDWLVRFLEHRIGDKRVLRLVRKWLRAGVSEEGEWSPSTEGTPQGAVISPLLANVYLHYVLDLWIAWWRKHHATGEVVIVRYADDFVIGFQHEGDARLCLEELRERFTRFNLTLHPDKTRLIEFGSWAARRRKKRGDPKPESFDFLGFTHSCSTTRQGRFFVRRKSIASRMRAKLAFLKKTLMRHRHAPIPQQGAWLRRAVQGWFNYHAVPYNITSLSRFRFWIDRIWWRALRRRSQRARETLWWPRMRRIIDRWLPVPRITHPWPNARFAVKHPR